MRTMKNYLFTLLLFVVSITLLFTTTAPLLNTQNLSIKLTNVEVGEIYVATGNEKMKVDTSTISGATKYICTGGTDIKNLSKLKYGDILVFTIKNCIIKVLPEVVFTSGSTIQPVDPINPTCIYTVQGLERISLNTYRVIDKVVIEKTLAE